MKIWQVVTSGARLAERRPPSSLAVKFSTVVALYQRSMYRVDGPLGPVETGGIEQRALTKLGMPGDPFWCPHKTLYPYLYLYL